MVALLVAIAVAVGFVVAFELAGLVRAWRHDRLLAWPVALPGTTAPAAGASSTSAGDRASPSAEAASPSFEELFAEAIAPAATASEVASTGSGGVSAPRRVRQLEAEPDADLVLQALIERVAASRRDVAGAVTAMLRDGHAELALFGADVPARPGRLSDFADLSTVERRRVIIRVLCLLLAQDAEDGEDAVAAGPDGGPAEEAVDEHDAIVIDLRSQRAPAIELPDPVVPTAGPWADVADADESRTLPQRRRLARSAR